MSEKAVGSETSQNLSEVTISEIQEGYATLRERFEAAKGNGDEGSMVAAAIAGQVWKHRRPLMKLGALVGAGVLVGGTLAAGHNDRYPIEKITASANLGEAVTEAEVELIQFDPTQEINVANAYFDETLTATDVKYTLNFDTRLPLLGVRSITCEGNKELSGVGAVKFAVPFEAITQEVDETTNKVDFVIDGSSIKATAFWQGAGPTIRDFTINSKGRNYEDRTGGCQQTINTFATIAANANIDGMKNTLDDMHDAVEHDMRIKGIEAFSEGCPSELEPRVKDAVISAVEANVAMLGRSEDLGTVNFSNELIRWTEDKGPEFTIDAPEDERISFKYENKEFELDTLNCSVNEEQVNG